MDPDALPFQLETQPFSVIEQGYLSVDESQAREVRLRNRDGHYTLTVKVGLDTVRDEGEVELSERQFHSLWPFTEGQRVEKVRHDISLGELTAELDIYGGRHAGLAVVEVEFPDEEAARDFAPPDWFGKEVTRNGAYRNQSLAFIDRPPTTGADLVDH